MMRGDAVRSLLQRCSLGVRLGLLSAGAVIEAVAEEEEETKKTTTETKAAAAAGKL